MSFHKPFYSLNIKSARCGYVICINGAYVEVHEDSESLAIEYPVNHWLKNKQNNIEVFLSTIDDPETGKARVRRDAVLEVRLYVKEAESSDKSLVSQINFDASKLNRKDENAIDYDALNNIDEFCSGSTTPGSYAIENGKTIASTEGEYRVGSIIAQKGKSKGLCLTQPIELPLPHPEWMFFSGETHEIHFNLSDDEWEDKRTEMIAEYQKLWDALEAKDYDTFAAQISDRCKEIDLAFYRDEGQTCKNIIRKFKLNSSDPEWPLKPLSKNSLDYAVAYNQQIVWMHPWDKPMSGAIALKHTKSDMVNVYPLAFAKINGQWKIVR
ncbi:hypothetical protein [Agaribacterium haliotis]|uniref:hypothetical protein n=1 Tax=Agaribacterium haliotis TaxID=2013869 RepID=UPI000BB56AEE|nr:hypothetical protein [Agaribacterium haliotis]